MRLLFVVLAPFIVVVGGCSFRAVAFAVLGAALSVLVFKLAGGACVVILSVVGVA